MAKRSNHRTVVFLKDFATKKAGEELSADGMLTTSLVNRGIAEYKKLGDNSIAEKVSEPINTGAGEAPAVQVSKQKSSSKPKSKK